jgi:hypothetical protein
MHESGELFCFKRVCLSMRVCSTRTRGCGGVHYLVCVLAQARRARASDCVREYMHECVHVHLPECVCACMHVRVHTCVHMLVCVCARVRLCMFPKMCARERAHACACTRVRARCMRVRARCEGTLNRLWPWYSPASLALRAGAQIPRNGKAGRSRNPHMEPTLLHATTAGAAAGGRGGG